MVNKKNDAKTKIQKQRNKIMVKHFSICRKWERKMFIITKNGKEVKSKLKLCYLKKCDI